MGIQVTWTYDQWLVLFPEFAAVPQAQVTAIEANVVEASLIRNDGIGPVTKAGAQLALLNFATAHVVFLLTRAQQSGGGGLVGAITSASEGSVSVGTTTVVTANSKYWDQSAYGQTVWQMMAPYKTMRYLPACSGNGIVPLGAAVPGIGLGYPYG